MAATTDEASTWTPLLAAVVGSTAYGLATATSDVDTLMLAAAPTERFLGVHPPGERDLTHVSTDPDITVHEAGKFVRLCLSANPSVTELLWMPRDSYTMRSLLGDQLIDRRSCFLSRRRVLNAYFGYAWEQFERLSRKGAFANVPANRIEKHARHIMRLVIQGEQLYTTGQMTVRVENPQRLHEFGAVVASDQETGIEHARQFIEASRARLDEVTSPLPEEPDVRSIEDWLQAVRFAHLPAMRWELRK